MRRVSMQVPILCLLWHRLCLCQRAPALCEPKVQKPVCAAEHTLPGTDTDSGTVFTRKEPQ